MGHQALFCKIVFFLIIGTASAIFDKCIVPEDDVCPNVNITFHLYTRTNRNNPYQLFATAASISAAPFVAGAPMKFVVHGYNGNKDTSPNTFIRPAYLDTFDLNVISVDYGPLAPSPCYLQAVQNVDLVARCTAQLLDALVQNGYALSRFHVIGFSLGGQVAGRLRNFMGSGLLPRISGPMVTADIKIKEKKTKKKLLQLTNIVSIMADLNWNHHTLDAALPGFVTLNNTQKLDSGDAQFVDALHTNGGQNGQLTPIGTADFFANGGSQQPGCLLEEVQDIGNTSSCNHQRAPMYFAESITTQVGFYAVKCFLGFCGNDEILYGEYVPLSASGKYFFSTNAQSPYAQGHRN